MNNKKILDFWNKINVNLNIDNLTEEQLYILKTEGKYQLNNDEINYIAKLIEYKQNTKKNLINIWDYVWFIYKWRYDIKEEKWYVCEINNEKRTINIATAYSKMSNSYTIALEDSINAIILSFNDRFQFIKEWYDEIKIWNKKINLYFDWWKIKNAETNEFVWYTKIYTDWTYFYDINNNHDIKMEIKSKIMQWEYILSNLFEDIELKRNWKTYLVKENELIF